MAANESGQPVAETADRDANSALRDRLAEVYGRYERLRSEMEDLQRRLASLRVTATSADGMIRATVDPRGQLVELSLDRRVCGGADTEHLSRTIVAVARDAAQRTAAQVEAMMAEHLPPESGALRFFRENDLGPAAT